jgi:LuxR family quorum sensing-dependent transcriptional regulator
LLLLAREEDDKGCSMALAGLREPGRQPGSAHVTSHVQARLLDYAARVDELKSPTEVLDELHAVTSQEPALSVLGAARMPIKSGDWRSIELGKSAFLHKDVPENWWHEYEALIESRFRPVLFLASSSIGAYTWTEARRLFQPVGVDQISLDLALKHGLRDGFTCPVGGRWVVGFWSRRDLSNVLTRPMRIMVFAAASFAALRLEQIVPPDPAIFGTRRRLTPRELAVLRLVSTGAQFREVGQALGLGEETVRSHMKKAQAKLGARSRTQAVAEALRQRLIP